MDTMETPKSSAGGHSFQELSSKIQRAVSHPNIDVHEINQKMLTFGGFVKSKLYDTFESNIPIEDIKEIPNPFWKTFLGIMSSALMLGVFIYFVVTSKEVIINKQ